MRISFALPGLNLSGGTRVVFDYANYLIERGHEVSVVVPAPKVPSLKHRFKALIKREPIPQEPNATIAHPSWTKVPVIRGQSSKGLSTGDFPDADIVIATWWETGEWIADLPSAKGKKVHFVQDHEVFPYLPIERVHAIYAQAWPKIAVSSWLADICRHHYHSETVFCVPNGVSLDQFSGKIRSKNNTPVAGMLWSISERKNSAMGLEALKNVKSIVPELNVVMFGNSQRPEDLMGLDWVDYYRRPEQKFIPQIYAKCDVWLFPSRSEGFGLPILESMAMHTPVVATQAGAVPELINRENGLIVDCTAPAMTAGLVQIIQEPTGAWAVRSLAAREIAECNSLECAAMKFESALLRTVISDLMT